MNILNDKMNYYNRPKYFEYKVVGTVVMLIAILIMFLALFSCEREKDFCWECESIKLDRIDTCSPIMKREVFEMCYKTEDWIRHYEAVNTYIICDNSSMLRCTRNE